jgi:hypothetical protein
MNKAFLAAAALASTAVADAGIADARGLVHSALWGSIASISSQPQTKVRSLLLRAPAFLHVI